MKRFGYRKIPKKTVINGSKQQGQALISRANSELNILQEQMNFQHLEQGHRTVKLDNGAVIECWMNHGMSQVNIYTPSYFEEGGAVDKECFCCCHLAVGTIINPYFGCYDWMDSTKTYDVEICFHKNRYVLIEGVLPMFMQPFSHGQRVLVVFEPANIDDQYVVAKEGCEMIRCRITNLNCREQKFEEVAA